MKKITRNVLASPMAAGTLAAKPGGVASTSSRPATNVTTKPMMNFGKRCQISRARALSLPIGLMWLVQMYPRMKAQMPMKMSMNTFTSAVVPRIQPAW